MSKIILRDPLVLVNGVNLSDHCGSIVIDDEADDVDVTSFGTAAYDSLNVGFKDATITCEFFQDYAAGSVHRVLQPLYDTGQSFLVTVMGSGTGDPGTIPATIPFIVGGLGFSVPTPTNPQFLLTSRLFDYDPLAGALDDAVTFEVEFRNAGQGLVEITSLELYPSDLLYPADSLLP